MLLLALGTGPVVEAPSCKPPWFQRARFESLLKMELHARNIERVRIRLPACEVPVVAVMVQTSTASAQTKLSLQDVPAAMRMRALVLSIAELRLEPSQLPPGAPSQKKTAPSPVPKLKTAASATVGPQRIGSMVAAFALRSYPGRQTTLLGGRLALSLPLGLDSVAGTAALSVMGGRVTETLGQIEVLTVSGTLGVSLSHRFGPIVLSGGPQLELGWARLRGLTQMSEVQTSAAGGLIAVTHLRLAMDYRLLPSLLAQLEFTGGWVARGFAALGEAGVSGGALGLSMGLVWGW